jgi:hypothetical protein
MSHPFEQFELQRFAVFLSVASHRSIPSRLLIELADRHTEGLGKVARKASAFEFTPLTENVATKRVPLLF